MKNSVFSLECDEHGNEIDRLTISKNYEGLKTYLNHVTDFAASHDSFEYAPIFYYLGTGYGTLSDYRQVENETQKDSQAIEYRKLSLYYMRKALSFLENTIGEQTLLLALYTNYANQLEVCGRVIEALRIYRKAIALYPNFGMALGNYGQTLNHYAILANDPGHKEILHYYAYHSLKQALRIPDPNVYKEAANHFKMLVREYEPLVEEYDLESPIAFSEYDLGETEEKEYRLWCLKNHLFLNPLNDLVEEMSSFAHDPLTITHYTEMTERDDVADRDAASPPKWFSMLNQLKEEYIYSRFLFYEGSEKGGELHYGDKQVALSLTGDSHVAYSMRIEQLKSAFKNLYSIFDQIAFVINEFWMLGFSERQASASKVFDSENYPVDNSALTALYWSHCEFSEKFGNAEKASERDLKVLRDALEHKFVKVYTSLEDGKLQKTMDNFYHISEEEMKKLTHRLLELAREWIMELVYAIGIEEKKTDQNKIKLSMYIRDYDDEWKV